MVPQNANRVLFLNPNPLPKVSRIRASCRENRSGIRACSPYKDGSHGLIPWKDGVVLWDLASFLSRDVGFPNPVLLDFDGKIPSTGIAWFLTSKVVLANS